MENNKIIMTENFTENCTDNITETFEEPTYEELCLLEKELENDIYDETEDAEFYSEEAIQMYLNDIGKIALLTKEEEQQLGEIIAEGGPGAIEARNKLVSSNLRLVMHYAKKYVGRNVDLMDLNLMGIEGLIRAAEKYDYTMNFRFSTYATAWIMQAITRGIADEGSTVRIPVHMNEVIYKVNRAQKVLSQELSHEPTVIEIAEFTGISENKVKQALESKHNIISFDTKVGEDGDTTIGDLLEDKNASDPCDVVVDSELRDVLENVLDFLTEKEALVLKLRFGIGIEKPMTLEEISKYGEFDVTRERIRQIEEKALRKIRRSHAAMSQLREFAS